MDNIKSINFSDIKMKNIVELDLDSFKKDPAILSKLFRTIDYFNKNFERDSSKGIIGYIFENSNIDHVYIDGTGFVSPGEYGIINKEYIQFRPAFTIKDGRLRLYNLISFGAREARGGGGDKNHLVIPSYTSVAWVVCEPNSYNKTKNQCMFTSFLPETAKDVEKQHQSRKSQYEFNLIIDDGRGNVHEVDYIIYPDKSGNPELFMQVRAMDI